MNRRHDQQTSASLSLLYTQVSGLGSKYYLAVAVGAVGSLIGLLPPRLLIYFTDGATLIADGKIQDISSLLKPLIVFGLVVSACLLVSSVVSQIVEEWLTLKVEASLRVQALKSIQKSNARSFDESQRGDWLTRLSMDLRSAQEFITTSIPSQFQSFVTVMGITVLFYLHSPLAASICLVTATFVALLNLWVQTKINPLLESLRTTHGEIFQGFMENYEGFRTVRSFSAESFMNKKFKRKIDSLIISSMRVAKIIGSLMGANSFVSQALLTVCLSGAAWSLNKGQLGLSEVLVFPFYIGMFYTSALSLIGSIFDWNLYFIEGGRLALLLQPPKQEIYQELEDLLAQEQVQSIDLENIQLHATDGMMLMKPFNFSLNQGELTVIQGHSGCGKSTFLEFLSGLRSASFSTMKINTQNSFSRKYHGKKDHYLSTNLAAYVEQVPFLFQGSLRENIELGQSYSDEDLLGVLESLNLNTRFKGKSGLDVKILDQGKNLSEGEKYRITLARALLSDRSVLLLDEPFAALDDLSVRHVVAALNERKEDKSICLVSHVVPKNLDVDNFYQFEPREVSNIKPSLNDSTAGGSNRYI